MAIYIKPVPTLRGYVADKFNRMAERNATSKRASVDFTEKVKTTRAILEKSKFNK